MKLAVLGGTGQIGRHFLARALRSGYDIHLLASSMTDKTVVHPRLRIAQGDLNDIEQVEDVLFGAAAVIALPQAIDTLDSLGTVVQTMYANSIRRLIIAADLSRPETRIFESNLKNTQLDWTIIEYASAKPSPLFNVPPAAMARYLVSQITDVANIRSALLLSN